jgi:hypothetical protein
LTRKEVRNLANGNEVLPGKKTYGLAVLFVLGGVALFIAGEPGEGLRIIGEGLLAITVRMGISKAGG